MYMRTTEELTIKQLKRKIKELQGELCERTRNFLVRTGMRDREVQTESQPSSFSFDASFMKTASPMPVQSQIDRESSRKEDFASHFKKIDVSAFGEGQGQSPMQRKSKIGEILSRLIDEQRKKEEENLEKSNVNETFSTQISINQSEDQSFDRDKRRMRKEIKSLNAQLTFEKKVNQYAKEGLLISEEENYQFRLKIKQLLKIQNSSKQEAILEYENSIFEVETAREEVVFLQSQLEHEKQMKEQYLESCLLLKDQMENTQKENASLKKILQKVEEDANEMKCRYFPIDQREELDNIYGKSQKINQQFLEEIKDISFSISNCIPITIQHNEVNYFRPESESEVLSALTRVYQYCKDIERRQLQNIQQLDRQKKHFVTFLKITSESIDTLTKKMLSKQLSNMKELSHYLAIFKLQAEQTDSCPSQNSQTSFQERRRHYQ